MAKTVVIGIIAKVLVSLTIVALSSTVPFVPWTLSHTDAAAVTEEVSLIAVPANSAKPSFEKPKISPIVGKIIAAIRLNKNTTDIDWAISSSLASITGAVAAIADPPHIEEPTPIKIAIFLSKCITLDIMYDTTKEQNIVDRITGRELAPTCNTTFKFKPNPRSITAYCSIFLDVNFIPLSNFDLLLNLEPINIPKNIPKTGPPTTGIKLPQK